MFANTLLVILSIATLLLFFLIIIGAFPGNEPQDLGYIVDSSNASLAQKTGWINDQYIGDCELYNTQTQDYNTVINLPSTPVSQIATGAACLDGTNQTLAQASHVCNQPNCVGMNGLPYTQGQTEFYFKACGSLSPCTNELSSIAFDYVVNAGNANSPGTVATPLFCVNYSGITTGETDPTVNEVSLVSCGSKDISETILFNTTSQDLGGGASYMQVRLPGTVYCLGYTVDQTTYTVLPCSDMLNGGYVWIYNPELQNTSPCTGCIPSTQNILPASLCAVPSGGIPDGLTFTPSNNSQQQALQDFAASLKCLYNSCESSCTCQGTTCNCIRAPIGACVSYLTIGDFRFCGTQFSDCNRNLQFVPASLWQQVGINTET